MQPNPSPFEPSRHGKRAAALALALALALATLAPRAVEAQRFTYPETRAGDVVDDYHGTLVADPYRWLEDTRSAETQAWIEAQNRITFGYLDALPGRDAIEARLTELWNYERFTTPWREGDRYFFYRNDGLQNQSVLYVQDSLEGEPRVLIDPNTFSEDGTVALAGTAVSPQARYIAYGIASGGSDWRSYRVLDVATGRDLPDRIERLKFSGASWTRDEGGFFYSRYPSPTAEGDSLIEANANHQLFYHRVGTPQSEDRLIFEQPEHPQRLFGASVTDDGRYAFVYISDGDSDNNRIHYMDLGDPSNPDLDAPIVPLLDENDASYGVLGNVGSVIYLRTDLDAPMRRILAIDLERPERGSWRTVLPESERVIDAARLIGGRLVIEYLADARSEVRVFDLDGRPLGGIELPTLGSVGGLSGTPDSPELFYSFASFLYPSTIFRHDLDTGASEVFRAPRVDFDPGAYLTRQVFYTSADGTRVPMFITHRRDIELDGTNPTYLYAYGGFNISMTPGFSVSNLVWMEMGGVYAMANLRGGGEYGEEWHKAGTKELKQNVFDDFIAAAEHLIDEGYTSPERLSIGGGSNGGLLIGAVLNQRPELFGAALPAVGVMDMLRYHRFTIGWAWVPDYGSSDDPDGFDYLFAYSPLHNIAPGTCYPATMVTTADHDDRVVPGHSFKYAATLQGAQGCDNPTLIRVQTRAGHGAGKPTHMVIRESADRWAFLIDNLGARPRVAWWPEAAGVGGGSR